MKKNEEIKILAQIENILRKIIQKEYISNDELKINVDWDWINYFEIRQNKDKIRIEIWVADVKHQWLKLKKVSNMKFVTEQESLILISNIKSDIFVGAYIKLGDPYGHTLQVADFDSNYVKNNFNKKFYQNFYNSLGGQWRKNKFKDEFVRNEKSLINEIEKMNLKKSEKEKILKYIQNETNNKEVINLSLGTTVNIDIPINEIIKSKMPISKLAVSIYNLIINYKMKKIEDKS